MPCGFKLVIDHKNSIKTDNRLENLQIISQRQNVCKTIGIYASKYRGVTLGNCKKKVTWRSSIIINNKKINLGSFNTEYEAHLAYQNALQKHLNNE